jgi:hypothetical protein
MIMNPIPVIVVLCAMVVMIATVGYLILGALDDDDHWY